MTVTRRRYERALGAALVLVGAAVLLPLAYMALWASRVYTIGLSVDSMAAIVIGFGLLALLSGVVLLRRA